MKELQDIVEAAKEAERNGRTAILATVVQIEGSAYRRPGARMLITEDGWRAGSISGGCLESDLVERAWGLTARGEPALVTYDATDGGEPIFGLGLGCRGTVRILVERLTPGRTPDPVAFLQECLQGRGPGVLATVFRLQGPVGAKVGARLLLHHDGRVTCDIRDPGLAAPVEEDARRAVETGWSGPRTYPFPSGAAEVFVEVARPPTPLVIFGAGHDAAPILRLAKELGWRVTVVDSRPTFATSGRFPLADEVVVCLPEAILGRVRLDRHTAALVMTHNYLQDQKLLEILLPSPVRYLGVLGARSRTEQLLADLRGEGMTWSEEQLARLHAPVGLDIGAEGPEGIAIAVLAEIQAVLAGRSGGFLRQRTRPIHLESGPAQPASREGSWAGAKAASGLSAS